MFVIIWHAIILKDCSCTQLIQLRTNHSSMEQTFVAEVNQSHLFSLVHASVSYMCEYCWCNMSLSVNRRCYWLTMYKNKIAFLKITMGEHIKSLINSTVPSYILVIWWKNSNMVRIVRLISTQTSGNFFFKSLTEFFSEVAAKVYTSKFETTTFLGGTHIFVQWEKNHVINDIDH